MAYPCGQITVFSTLDRLEIEIKRYFNPCKVSIGYNYSDPRLTSVLAIIFRDSKS